MGEAPHHASTWMGIPMKHVSLVTVRALNVNDFLGACADLS